MESSESTLHCSFVVYLAKKDEVVLPAFLQDLHSFFQKFPLNYELIGALEDDAGECEKILQTAAIANPAIVIRKNPKYLGRALSIFEALRQAKGPRFQILSPELATPLGDSFKVLQHLLSDADTDIVWGERHSKKNHGILHRSTPRLKLENLFNKILGERAGTPDEDLLCEVGGFSRAGWEKLNQSLKSPPRGWYLGPIIKAGLRQNIGRFETIFVHDSGQSPPSFPLWKVRWDLLRQGLF